MDQSLELMNGRPIDVSNRLEKEIRVYDLLDQLGILYERCDHAPAHTMEDCYKVDQILDIIICKNLFLCNTQMTDFYLLMMPGEKRFQTKVLSKEIGSARLSFAPAEKMEEYLDITPGAVSIMGLMNDKQNHVQLLVDEDILHSEYIGCHPCVNTVSLKLKTKDVLDSFLPAVSHIMTKVKL